MVKRIGKLFWPLSKKKAIIWIVILAAGFLLFNFFQPKKAAALQFAQVKKQDIKSTVSSSGSLTGKDVANLKFKSAGKLAYINVKAGSIASEGEVIAGLDTQDLAIKLQQAENTLRDKQATAQKIEDDVKDHSADETYAQRATRTTAQAARDSAVDAVKDAQRAFGDAVLISPISGLVTQTTGIPGQNVSTADLIAQVVDNSQIMFDTDIDEADIGKIAVGQEAEVTLDAYEGQIFKGIVDQILPQTKTTSTNATVVTVRITLNTTPKTFVNGLSGQASIILAEVKDALTIPQEALREEDSTVFVQKDQNLRPVRVKVGIKSDTDVEIKEGLNEGDRVLLNPPAQGTRINQNRNPIQGMIFRVFGGGRGGGGNVVRFGSPPR